MSTPSTDARVAELIRDLWPHRMSGEAARGIRRIFLNGLAAEVRAVNEANGWFEEDRRPAEGLALIHSEVSEWLEAIRSWGLADVTGEQCATDPDGVHLHGDKPCKPEGVGSEAADVLIRLLDECDRQGIDLQAEFDRKIAHNVIAAVVVIIAALFAITTDLIAQRNAARREIGRLRRELDAAHVRLGEVLDEHELCPVPVLTRPRLVPAQRDGSEYEWPRLARVLEIEAGD